MERIEMEKLLLANQGGVHYQAASRKLPKYPDSRYDQFAIFVSNVINVGGASGGNCYGSEAGYYRNDDADVLIEMNQLTAFILQYLPDLTFATYHKLQQKFQKMETSHSEYYGNYTNYKFVILTHSDFLDVIYG